MTLLKKGNLQSILALFNKNDLVLIAGKKNDLFIVNDENIDAATLEKVQIYINGMVTGKTIEFDNNEDILNKKAALKNLIDKINKMPPERLEKLNIFIAGLEST